MEKPILFNTDMVQAILEGRKTETRRPIKPHLQNRVIKNVFYGRPPGFKEPNWISNYENDIVNYFGHVKPPCKIGDILYVRETWANTWTPDGRIGFVYKADGKPHDFPYWGNESTCKHNVWRPSIHMPKEAARLFLKVTEVRSERVQDITEEMAMAEGIKEFTLTASNGITKLYGVNSDQSEMSYSAREEFKYLWDGVYKNWSENPWVWVIKFERVDIKP